MYFVYIIRCMDNSLYTGITTDFDRRMKEHLSLNKGGAKYTKLRTPKQVECIWLAENRALASKLEYRLKTLKKNEKEALIKNPALLDNYFGEKLNTKDYLLF